MPSINVNGKLVPSNTPVVEIGNGGLRYGDGVFETMKWHSGKLILGEDHFERLWKGLKVLQFEIPEGFTPDYLYSQILKLIEHEALSSARVRLSVIRGNGGLFDPGGNEPIFFIEAVQLERPDEENTATRLNIYREARKTADILSPLKHNNYLPYRLAAIFARKNNLDDALLLNQFGRICDSTIANLFLMQGRRILTPALSEGCVAGVIRKNLLAELPRLGYSIEETGITEQMIETSEAAFLTNSIINLKAITSIGEKTFDPAPALSLKQIIEDNTNIFC